MFFASHRLAFFKGKFSDLRADSASHSGTGHATGGRPNGMRTSRTQRPICTANERFQAARTPSQTSTEIVKDVHNLLQTATEIV